MGLGDWESREKDVYSCGLGAGDTRISELTGLSTCRGRSLGDFSDVKVLITGDDDSFDLKLSLLKV